MKDIGRRQALGLLAAGALTSGALTSGAAALGAAASGCVQVPEREPAGGSGAGLERPRSAQGERLRASAGAEAVLSMEPLSTPWQTRDPFLFCMHHKDRYPRGNERLGPAASLAGHQMGRDFAGVDGWRMYHGANVPGFPRHPHRGFETVTVVKRGLLDHSDSLGATARYGQGDVQWLTAGRGILHAEMFPLLSRAEENPLELFQIWLNLPSANKMVEPHFSMLWQPAVPILALADARGRAAEVRVIAGRFGHTEAPAPPPRSWAAERDHQVAIWDLRLDPGATLEVPAGPPGVSRDLYVYEGRGLTIGGRAIPPEHHVRLRPQEPLALHADLGAGRSGAAALLLQGRPIGEPVARHGPFVMNTDSEIRQAYADYRATQFGGWPWPSDEHVHTRGRGRFALRPDGGLESPPV